ncbi:hypothetical protein HaLaN_01897, partial [Haematococcus lacustris]
MREEVLGRRHLETSMSLNQVALTRMDLAKQALARAVDGKGAVDEAHQRWVQGLGPEVGLVEYATCMLHLASCEPCRSHTASATVERHVWRMRIRVKVMSWMVCIPSGCRHARDLLVQAEMELMESLDIRKAGLGPHQPLVANTLQHPQVHHNSTVDGAKAETEKDNPSLHLMSAHGFECKT